MIDNQTSPKWRCHLLPCFRPFYLFLGVSGLTTFAKNHSFFLAFAQTANAMPHLTATRFDWPDKPNHGVLVVLVVEGHWFKRIDCFTALAHWLNVLLESRRGEQTTKPAGDRVNRDSVNERAVIRAAVDKAGSGSRKGATYAYHAEFVPGIDSAEVERTSAIAYVNILVRAGKGQVSAYVEAYDRVIITVTGKHCELPSATFWLPEVLLTSVS